MEKKSLLADEKLLKQKSSNKRKPVEAEALIDHVEQAPLLCFTPIFLQ